MECGRSAEVRQGDLRVRGGAAAARAKWIPGDEVEFIRQFADGTRAAVSAFFERLYPRMAMRDYSFLVAQLAKLTDGSMSEAEKLLGFIKSWKRE